MREAVGREGTAWATWDATGEAYLRSRVRQLEAEKAELVEHALHLERVAEVGVLTSALTHDLTNQLTCVLGAAEIARAQGGPDALDDGLCQVLEHAARMHETLDAYLGFVRRREHRIKPFPVAEVVATVQRLIQPSARAQAVTLLSTTSTQAWVRADRQLLEQALVNLVRNALRAAAAGGGRVAMSVTEVPGSAPECPQVRITVRDTGPGIPEEIRTRIFEPFVTGNGASGGCGLGLYIVRRFVEHARGSIAVDSSPSGTRFELDLPAEAPAVEIVGAASQGA